MLTMKSAMIVLVALVYVSKSFVVQFINNQIIIDLICVCVGTLRRHVNKKYPIGLLIMSVWES